MQAKEKPLNYTELDPFFDEENEELDLMVRKSNRERVKRTKKPTPKQRDPERAPIKRERKPDGSETFRCRHCRRMVGPTISGGQHRNHCPVCLYSLHVDGKTPGDRRSECRSLMKPVALYTRVSGEQVIVHQCLGCGFQRFNRVAADDNPIAVMELPPFEPSVGDETELEDDDLP